MSVDAMREDIVLCRRTEQRTLAASVAAHALLFFLLVRMGPVVSNPEQLTEVSLLEPGVPTLASAPASAAPAAAAPRTETGVLQQHEKDAHFRRADRGDIAPDPQTKAILQDRLNERLATLQRTTPPTSIAGLATVEPRLPQLASPTGLPDAVGSGGGAPLALKRSGSGGGGQAPLALARGPSGTGGDLALAGLPAEKPSVQRAAGAPARALSRASLAGVSLAGPIADRPVLEAPRPAYPEWAKSEAVEGTVTLYFLVSPNGEVQENVLVQKTAGFEDFDSSATQALRSWRFAPLAAGRTGDQWGTITFHFRLADAR